MPPGPRKSAADISRKFGSPRLIQAFRPGQAEPTQEEVEQVGFMDKINQVREGNAENRLARMAAMAAETEMEMETAEMEVKKTEVQLRGEEARARLAELRGQGNAGNNDMLLAMVDMLREELSRARESAGTRSTTNPELISHLAEMTELVADTRKTVLESMTGKGKKPLEELSESMQTLNTLRELMGSFAGSGVHSSEISAAERDLHHTVEMHKVTLEHEREMARLQMQRDQWASESALRREELQVEIKKSENLGQGLSAVLDNFAPVIQDFMATRVGAPSAPVAAAGTWTTPPPAPVPGAPSTMPVPVNTVPEPTGLPCPKCQLDLADYVSQFSPEEQQDVIACPRCGQTLKVEV